MLSVATGIAPLALEDALETDPRLIATMVEVMDHGRGKDQLPDGPHPR